MNNSFTQNSLDDVLDAYSEASEIPSRELLAEWIARYPQYENELIEFTVAWIQSEVLPEPSNTNQDLDSLLESGLGIVQKILDKKYAGEQSKRSPSSMVSLFLEAKLLGWSTEIFAQKINLSVSMLRKLENRLINMTTIPISLINILSESLHRDPSEVSAYLSHHPVLQAGHRYKSRQAPKIGDQQSFYDAIRNDGELTDEQRTLWLSFESGTE